MNYHTKPQIELPLSSLEEKSKRNMYTQISGEGNDLADVEAGLCLLMYESEKVETREKGVLLSLQHTRQDNRMLMVEKVIVERPTTAPPICLLAAYRLARPS